MHIVSLEPGNHSIPPNAFGALQARVLGPPDIPAIFRLRMNILSRLENPDLYVPESDEAAFVRAHCGEQGETFGLFCADQLIAYAMLGFPAADDPENLGYLLGLDHDRRSQVAHLASCMVDDAFRSRRLQQALLRTRFALAQKMGRTLCVGMTSLLNDASRHSMLRTGCNIDWVGEIDQLRRQLLVKNLVRAAKEPRFQLRVKSQQRIDSKDYDGQRALIAAGLHGVAEQLRGDRIDLIFVPGRCY